jgi:gas vesicle structural protein
MNQELSTEQRVTLLELLDRALDKGVVLSGDITLSVADVDLVYVGLRVLVSSVEAAARAREVQADSDDLHVRDH